MPIANDGADRDLRIKVDDVPTSLAHGSLWLLWFKEGLDECPAATRAEPEDVVMDMGRHG